MTAKPTWDIRNEGRAWRATRPGAATGIRRRSSSDRGKLLWSDQDREALLGLLLENVGADCAVQLGDPEVLRAAVAKLPRPS